MPFTKCQVEKINRVDLIGKAYFFLSDVDLNNSIAWNSWKARNYSSKTVDLTLFLT